MSAVNMSAVNPISGFNGGSFAGLTEDQYDAMLAALCANATAANYATVETPVQKNDDIELTMTNEEFAEAMFHLDPENAEILASASAMDIDGLLPPTELVVAAAPINFEANNVGIETSDVLPATKLVGPASAMNVEPNNVAVNTYGVSANANNFGYASAMNIEANNVAVETNDVSMTDAPSDLMDEPLMDPAAIQALMAFDPRDVQYNQNHGAQVYADPETPKRNETRIVYGLPTPQSNSELESAQAPATTSTTTPPTTPETTPDNSAERSIKSLPGHETQFSSLAAIREAMRQVDRRHNPKDDESIPTTDEEKQILVGKLIVVLKNMEGIRDGEAAIRTFNNRNYTDVDYELTAWEILEAMLTRHNLGASLTPAHAKRKTGLFKDRFLTVCHALNCSKSVAKHCLDVAYVKTFVDHPQGALDRVIGNKRVNDRKGVLLKVAKEALSK